MVAFGGHDGHRVVFAVAVVAVRATIVVEHGVACGDGAVMHVVRLPDDDVIGLGDGFHLSVFVGDGQGDVESAGLVVGDSGVLQRRSGWLAAFEGPFPTGQIGTPCVVSEVDAGIGGDDGRAGVEVGDESLTGIELYVEVDGLAIGHGDGVGLRIVAVFGIGHLVGAAFDGTVVVARRQVAFDKRVFVVVAFDGDGGVERLSRGAVGHGAVDAVEALRHIGEEAFFVVGPIGRKLVGVGQLRVGTLNDHKAPLMMPSSESGSYKTM